VGAIGAGLTTLTFGAGHVRSDRQSNEQDCNKRHKLFHDFSPMCKIEASLLRAFSAPVGAKEIAALQLGSKRRIKIAVRLHSVLKEIQQSEK
jgi:hypothetical protein